MAIDAKEKYIKKRNNNRTTAIHTGKFEALQSSHSYIYRWILALEIYDLKQQPNEKYMQKRGLNAPYSPGMYTWGIRNPSRLKPAPTSSSSASVISLRSIFLCWIEAQWSSFSFEFTRVLIFLNAQMRRHINKSKDTEGLTA